MLELDKIYNMDCIEGMKQIPDNSIDLVISDPPYNVGIDDWDKIDDYEEFSIDWLKEAIRILKPNKALYVFCNQHNVTTLNFILSRMDLVKFRSWIIWNKGTGIPNPNNFTNHHEQILYYIKSPNHEILSEFGKYIKQKRQELGLSLKDVGNLCGEKWYYRGGHLYFETGLTKPNVEQYSKIKKVLKLDNRFDIWFDNNFIFNLEQVGIKWIHDKDKRNHRGWKNCGDIWDINQLSGNFKERLKHPCQKPSELIERIVKVSSIKNDIILDLFSGTGTSSFVCKKLMRHYLGFELEKEWCDASLKRLLNVPKRLDTFGVKLTC